MKKLIRAEILRMRDTHPESERVKKSGEIERHLFILPEFAQARTIMFYASTKKEVHTHDMLAGALKLGKRIALPYVLDHELGLGQITSLNDLAPGKFGIPEPPRQNGVDPGEIELAIIPGIAFDEKGDRVGYGMGYFDKLLKKTKCPSVGLAFEFQIVPHFPREDHDVAVKKIITEKRVIVCSR